MRVAILWNEMWYEGLEDASRMHFAEHNPDQAVSRLKPLHEMLEKVVILYLMLITVCIFM